MLVRILRTPLWIVLAFTALGDPDALCDTVSSWKGGTSFWGTASNWNPPAVPNNSVSNTYSVTIGSGGIDQVTIDPGLNPTVNSLTLGGATGISSLQYAATAPPTAALSVTGNVTVNPTGSLNFGSFDGFGAGPFRGSLLVAGTLTNSGAVSVYPRPFSAQNVNNSGSLVLMGEPSVGSMVFVPGVFTNTGTTRFGVVGIDGPGAPPTTIGQLDNKGTLSVSGAVGGYVTTHGLQNAGSITITRPSSAPPNVVPLGGLNVGTGTPQEGYDQFTDGTLNELVASGSSFGSIAVDGPVSLAGTLQIVFEDGFVPKPGQSFDFLTFAPGELSGTFSQVQGDPGAIISYDNSAGFVSFTQSGGGSPVPEPGTFVLFGLGLLITTSGRMLKYRHQQGRALNSTKPMVAR